MLVDTYFEINLYFTFTLFSSQLRRRLKLTLNYLESITFPHSFPHKFSIIDQCSLFDVHICYFIPVSIISHWLLVLNFVSVFDQVRGLSVFAADLGFLVEEYAASKGQFPPRPRRKRKSLYIATIEKANSLVNSLIESGRISSIGLVVVDEVRAFMCCLYVSCDCACFMMRMCTVNGR